MHAKSVEDKPPPVIRIWYYPVWYEGSGKAAQWPMLPTHTQTGRAWKESFHARPVLLWRYE
jgi:hypothetical protein